MADVLKWAVVGSGGIARRRTIPEGFVGASNARLVGVCDVDGAANREVAKHFGVKSFRSLRGALAADIDAVYIATPAHLHARQTIACAKAGKHVLCEKPLGLSVRDARNMADACAAAGVALGTAFMMRCSTQHRAAADMVARGELGAMVYGRAQLSCWYPPLAGAWRQDPKLGGGGSLIDMGGHCIDLLEMFFGEAVAVTCRTANRAHDYPVEDTAVVLLEFAGGAYGTVDSCFCIPDASSQNRLEIYGTRGSILAEGTIGQNPAGRMSAFLAEPGAGYEAAQRRTEGGGIAIEPPARNTYRAEIEEFSAAVLAGREPSLSARRGIHSQEVLAACYRSAKSGRRVAIG
ncbi:MAG TPA: Gfo/Idh/MocA family oxidoreductase [Desulfobacterales bacterium]|nr:Gfo/Idh/MocA family oxidoreductase [Desulfobacterales bacterium]